MEQILSADYGFGCGGGNEETATLAWSGAPAGTKSFASALLRSRRADRLEASGTGWWRTSRPTSPSSSSTPATRTPAFFPRARCETRTDFGKPGYGGPCPPEGHGPHRYQFTVFAVKEENLPLDADTSAAIRRLLPALQHARADDADRQVPALTLGGSGSALSPFLSVCDGPKMHASMRLRHSLSFRHPLGA